MEFRDVMARSTATAGATSASIIVLARMMPAELPLLYLREKERESVRKIGRKGGDEGGGGYLMPIFTKWSGDSRSANASCWSASRLLVTLGFTGLLVS